MDSTQDLALQYHFNHRAGPSGNPRLIREIILLRVDLDKSRAEEAQAGCKKKRQWNAPSVRKPATRWLLHSETVASLLCVLQGTENGMRYRLWFRNKRWNEFALKLNWN